MAIETGQRGLSFEASGPTAAQALESFQSRVPHRIAGGAVRVESGVDETVVLQFDDGRVVIQITGLRALSLSGEANALNSKLNAIASLLSDPERSDAMIAVASRAPSTDQTLEDQAAELFAGVPTGLSRTDALQLIVRSIDLTTLAGDDTPGRVRALCAQALQPDVLDPTVGPTAAVCVYPNLVPVAVELTNGSRVQVASVASAFPSGLSSLEVRLADIDTAVRAGATEIDVVLNRAAMVAGDTSVVASELAAMRARVGTAAMKVIIETGELVMAQTIREATRLAIESGADWVKTSTGKSSVGATPAAVFAMAQEIARHDPVGIKISGGVRTSADALGYLAIVEQVLGSAWMHPDRIRFGASGLLTSVVLDLVAERP